MELTFTELEDDDINNYNTYYDNLITEPKVHSLPPFNNETKIQIQKSVINKRLEKPKKKISYDDILSSMNTVVIDGKLEFIKKDNLQNIMQNQNQQNPQNKNKVSFSKNISQNDYQNQINKNSYIYNKFFKGHKEPNQYQNEDQEPKRPLTKNELIKQLIINKVNSINERNRIAEIKSTKLLLNNNNNRNIVIKPRPFVNTNGLNHLFNLHP
jgi:hypothetical protein